MYVTWNFLQLLESVEILIGLFWDFTVLHSTDGLTTDQQTSGNKQQTRAEENSSRQLRLLSLTYE